MTRKRMNPLAKQRNSLFNFKSFNELKKDQTKIKIFKNSSFDSSFNSVQSLNTNLSHLLLRRIDSRSLGSEGQQSTTLSKSVLGLPFYTTLNNKNKNKKRVASPRLKRLPRSLRSEGATLLPLGAREEQGIVNYPKFSAILRAIRSIRLNRDEWKLIRYLNQIKKKIRSNGVDSSTLLSGKESNLKSYLYKKFYNKKEGIACARDGIITKLNPKERIKLRKLKRELKKFGRLLPPVVRGLETSLQRTRSPKDYLSAQPLSKRASLSQKVRDKNPILSPPARAGQDYNNLKQLIYNIKETQKREGCYKKIFSYNNIISKNILLRNMKFNFLKSTLSTILKKRIRLMSEILEDKPIKHYSLYSYLNFVIFSPPHLKSGKTKLSLNKYKGRKFGSFIKYNKIIGYNFNSTAPFDCAGKDSVLSVPRLGSELPPKEAKRGNIYVKDIYKLLFYLFKSMYCLISKPVLNYTNDKVTIQLFYYLNIPKKKVFRLFSISYINSIKKKWLNPPRTSLLPKGWKDGIYPLEKEKEASQVFTGGWAFLATLLKPKPGAALDNKPHQSRLSGGRGNTKIYIRWKLRKAISRLKFKIITRSPSLSRLKRSNQNRPLGSERDMSGGKNLLFNLRKFNLTKVYQNKFKLICAILSNKFNKPVELQLIRLHHPYHDSNILVNLLSLNIKNKRKKARVAIQKIYNKKPVKNLNDPNLKKPALPTADSLTPLETGKLVPAFLSGLNIKIAGRLMGEPIIPRITTKIYGKGATATGKVNYLDVAKITKKNRKGAYTIKITSGQNFF
jgi:hypothetical protein